MRKDAIGFFWNDTPPPKPEPKAQPKRTPPPATWLAPDYLPGLQEALAFPVEVMTVEELLAAQYSGEELIYDIELYPNYFLAMFASRQTGKVAYVETYIDRDGQIVSPLDIQKLHWLINSFCTIGFNSLNYDMTITALALAGNPIDQLKRASDRIILERIRPYEVLREYGVKELRTNHIDVIEVAPLDASLKTYAGRLHAKKLQDLPFHPSTFLSPEQVAITRWYCVNDTRNTCQLYEHLHEHVELRRQFGKQYDMDLRSHSDAQMAEEVIRREIKKVTGRTPRRPKFGESIGKVFCYKPPSYLSFQSLDLSAALWDMSNTDIEVGPTGHALCPANIRGRTVSVGGKSYKVGLGGLHSMEKTQAVVANEHVRILDRDVTGYYPNLILKNHFAPPQLGINFLMALQGMVNRRTHAKRDMQAIEQAGRTKTDPSYPAIKAEADGLKIANNGIFGKLSDPFSTVYDVPNMVQVTLTGQLSLLMAIEWLELSGIPVISANTDGIVVACPSNRYADMQALFKAWEERTGLETEETEYVALYSRDVNNYIAVKLDGKTKTKGAYCERGSAHNSVLSKNPEALICSDAAQAYVAKGVPVVRTIRDCNDIRRFVTVRQVSGGGVKLWNDREAEYLGKTVRWYYSTNAEGELVYARNGNKVPKSDGARPCMVLPDTLPTDLNFKWYEAEAYRILVDVGALNENPLASKDLSS